MDVQSRAGDYPLVWQQPRHEHAAEDKEYESWIEEQGTRTEQEQEAEMTPTITPTAQMWRTATTIGRQCCRYLGNAPLGDGGLDYHLAGKFHAGCLEIE